MPNKAILPHRVNFIRGVAYFSLIPLIVFDWWRSEDFIFWGMVVADAIGFASS
jgi:hypothetical protein